MDVSVLTLLLTVVIGAGVFAFIFSQASQSSRKADRSDELAELQKTVRLLIERGMGGPPAADKALPQSQAASTNGKSAFNFSQPTSHSASTISPRSSPAIPSSPPSLSLGPAPLSPSNTKSPADVYAEVFQLQEAMKQLERRNRELARQLTLTEVSNVVDVERKYGIKAPGQPSEVKLTASEVETIRAIFNMFDVEQKGTISTSEIQRLHSKLGEPMSEEEAQAATKELDQDGTGQVNFHQFLYWWFEQHKNGKKSTRYTERFKLVSAKLSSDAFNVERVITQDSGTPYTLEYRLNFYYKQPNAALRQISPWHDVPLYRVGHGADGQIFNMVCEIPRYTRAKFECSTGEPYNPIKQDTQHGKLRYYKHGDIMFNYGFLPQTWEDPNFVPVDTGCPGDNDPLDVLDIGARQLRTGEIVAVKVLGVLALIDDGETDWKVLAICISDAMAHMLNDVDDVETHLPGTIKAIREYFRDYKSFSGKINSYALRAQAMPKQYAVRVIEDTHEHWKSLHIVNKRSVLGGPADAATMRPVAEGGGDVPVSTEVPKAHPHQRNPSVQNIVNHEEEQK